jgi:2-oxoglutarate dehydrogenase E1 component
MGRTRARQSRILSRARDKVIPIALHGDAAFAGQGIAAETLNLSGLRGYNVGGTVHVIINNLLGFTTPPEALHASRYATDVAKRLAIPIFHVNGEDPEAVVRAGRLAMEYRTAFHTDVVVDLIGYRRYGHSEVDDPTITQPRLYRDIEKRPLLWRSYASRIGADASEVARIEQDLRASFDRAQQAGRAMTRNPSLRTMPAYWDRYRGGPHDPSMEVETAVERSILEEISRAITTTPEDFQVHPKLTKLLAERREMAEGVRPLDWGMAEALAFGSLLRSGTPVRLSGQDSRRGTFNQRHAVLFEAGTGEEYVPLRNLSESQALFEVCDSMLSEAAVLGFEYGFSRDYPEALVCWEAQFGDFANGAQVILDQFVAAAEDKWALLSGLTMLLPHGYEGQGPEHSSARLERYLQLAAEDNLQICQPSTAAQYFHLLRRQALRPWRKPLVVLTPKSLLRAAAASSTLFDLSGDRFHAVLSDGATAGDASAESDRAAAADRLLVASGKVAHELIAERARRNDATTAIVRIEQLYPFPEKEVEAVIERHAAAREIVWVQEEPANMGALTFILPRLERVAGGRRVTSVKRSPSASPATGSFKAHAIEQRALLDLAFARLG